ncbi:MAG TPA: ABC transporter permease [Thermoanaerobaculia bacterium]|nr:ABC transporter permease [Thermoanaerobaculia bacterium]
MTTPELTANPRPAASAAGLTLTAMVKTALALVERDLAVLFHDFFPFSLRTALQPALFAFVFAYVFPRIGQGIGASHAAAFAAVLLPGLMANTLMFQGVTGVTLPLVTEFSVSKEIEDRVMAPVPVVVVGLTKVVSSSFQAFVAGWLVVPAVWIATGGNTPISWAHPIELLTIMPLCALVGSALGLVLGTVIHPRRITYLFGILLVPLSLLGCVYYPWMTLHTIPWLQYLTLINPVVYMSEGLRAALSPAIPHMPLWAVYGLLLTALAAMLALGLAKFKGRVLT